HYEARLAFQEAVADLMAMYSVKPADLVVAHDRHPQYASTAFAESLGAPRVAIQHHRAHVASVLAERGAWGTRVLGIAFDGTGYGDDGSIWGGELLAGSLRDGFERVAHLRPADLPGGDAAARHPVQAAAGFLSALDALPDVSAEPFGFGRRYSEARDLVNRQVRVFRTTSVGRLFDVVAALLGFTRPVTFEGQAAIWLEQLAGTAHIQTHFDLEIDGAELDWRPTLQAVVDARCAGVEPATIAAAFHRGLAGTVGALALHIAEARE